MSTNYYARRSNESPETEGLHIGKSSSGWEFMWRAHAAEKLFSVSDWYVYLSNPNILIFSEYGQIVPFDEFWPTHTDRSRTDLKLQWTGKPKYNGDYRDEYGCAFAETEFS